MTGLYEGAVNLRVFLLVVVVVAVYGQAGNGGQKDESRLYELGLDLLRYQLRDDRKGSYTNFKYKAENEIRLRIPAITAGEIIVLTTRYLHPGWMIVHLSSACGREASSRLVGLGPSRAVAPRIIIYDIQLPNHRNVLRLKSSQADFNDKISNPILTTLHPVTFGFESNSLGSPEQHPVRTPSPEYNEHGQNSVIVEKEQTERRHAEERRDFRLDFIDEKGIVTGEFRFLTGDGVSHFIVYAAYDNGDFKILSAKNIKVNFEEAPSVRGNISHVPVVCNDESMDGNKQSDYLSEETVVQLARMKRKAPKEILEKQEKILAVAPEDQKLIIKDALRIHQEDAIKTYLSKAADKEKSRKESQNKETVVFNLPTPNLEMSTLRDTVLQAGKKNSEGETFFVERGTLVSLLTRQELPGEIKTDLNEEIPFKEVSYCLRGREITEPIRFPIHDGPPSISKEKKEYFQDLLRYILKIFWGFYQNLKTDVLPDEDETEEF
ncbi:hypothetical protein ANN_00951 [Periplaneta americana]|uniref:Uncharacterized protein n=1 Tax=Periplaneta americana TaxID=6978 RepID=A0ABQ8TSB8_PERAM|nr:hypothetical protein ANN_00951 [Periplaneta americana]